MRIAITGATGFVGPHVLRTLTDHTIIPMGGPRDKESEHAIDITNEGPRLKAWLIQEKPDAILHLAGFSAVGRSWTAPAEATSLNVLGTLNVWQAAIAAKVRRFVHVSSGEIYGRLPQPIPVAETSAPKPLNPYAIGKWAAEQLLHALNRDGTCELLILRPFNHVGPGQQSGFVIPDFLQKVAVAPRNAVIQMGNLNPVRDFVDVRDVARAYALALTGDIQAGTYNISSGYGRSIHEVLQDLLRVAGRTDLSIATDPKRTRAHDIPWLVGNSDRWQSLSGWSPTIPWLDTLRDIVS